jgi:hypothetical protein
MKAGGLSYVSRKGVNKKMIPTRLSETYFEFMFSKDLKDDCITITLIERNAIKPK